MSKRKLAPALLMLAATLAFAGKVAEKNEVVDSGSYGIFINGKRVATESFNIVQRSEVNQVRSEVKVEGGASAVLKSELLVTGTGELRRYQWNEISPGTAQAVVEPDGGGFLIERVATSPKEKSREQSYMMPTTTIILDDYFFTHRQVLAWRYLAAGCKAENGRTECRLPRSQFGVIVPRQHTSLMVTMEHAGAEKISVRGTERDLQRFNLKGEGLDWSMWLDENMRLIRVLISSENTEVLRD
jgi:hypothetical protein